MAVLPLLVVLSLGAPDSAAAPSQVPFHEYQQQVSDLLKRESQGKTDRARAAAVAEMCHLHGEIVHDARYSDSDVLKEYRSRLWSRLTKVKGELKAQLARDRKNRAALDTLQVLESANSANVAAADLLATSLALAGELQGAGTPFLALGGAPAPPDWGPDLVDLIERTINPAFWDVVGGPGTIIYYRPLQCLVVSATAEVHGNIGNLLGGIRK